MRRLCLLPPLVVLLFLAGVGITRWAEPAAGTASRTTDAGPGRTAARLAGRRNAATLTFARSHREIDDARRSGEIAASIVGLPERPHTPADRERLLAERDTKWEQGRDVTEHTLRDCEDHVANALSQPCGVLLTGREAGEGPDVDEAPWIDPATGVFEEAFRTPYDITALYVYGGRRVAQAPLTDSGTNLVVDPRAVFAKTGGIELSVRRGDTGEAVADVVLEIDAVGRDASAHADLEHDAANAVGLRPFQFHDLPAGVYHVRVERPGPPWAYGVSTIEVRPGTVTRETITLGPGASFRMRWYRPDGRPMSPTYTTVQLRDRENRLHEVPVRSAADDAHLLLVDHAPLGRCWLVTPDRRAHAVVPEPAPPGRVHAVRLEEWAYVVLVVRLESPPPGPLAARAPSHWVVRDEQGVIVEEEFEALTADRLQGDETFHGWAHLPPGRYHVHWQLTPDRSVERAFVVPLGGEEIRVDLDGSGP